MMYFILLLRTVSEELAVLIPFVCSLVNVGTTFLLADVMSD